MKFTSILILFIFTSCSQLPTKRTDKLSILQGVTNSKEVEFSILAERKRTLRFELRDENGEIITPDETKIVGRDFSPYVVHKIIFSKGPDKDYNFYAFEAEKVIDQRLIGKGQKEVSKLKMAVASCLDDFYGAHFNIWNELAKRNPEYLILIGDNVYTDKASITTAQNTDPEIIWNRYVDLRLTLPLYFQQKLIPTHALWDDHDYGVNNGDKSFKYREESKEIFEAFWAQDLSDDNWNKGLGVGGLLSLGDFNLYFLDGRSFRSDSPDESHLGLNQLAWFYSKLREEETPSFIIKGDQFFGGYHIFESFERHHPQEFQSFINELKAIKTPFIFLSGDRHMSEIMQFPRTLFGKPSFEITSSPLHGKTFDENELRNPWRVVGLTQKMSFTFIESLAQENHWFMDVFAIGENGDVYFRRELAVYIKDLQDNLKEVRKRRYGKRRYRKIRPRKRRR